MAGLEKTRKGRTSRPSTFRRRRFGNSKKPKKSIVWDGCCCIFLAFLCVGAVILLSFWLDGQSKRRKEAESLLGDPVVCRSVGDLSIERERMQRVVLGVQRYREANGGAYPAAYTVDAEGKPLHSWRVLILPYLGDAESALYEQIRLDEPWDSEWNSQFHAQTPTVFVAPPWRTSNVASNEKRTTTVEEPKLVCAGFFPEIAPGAFIPRVPRIPRRLDLLNLPNFRQNPEIRVVRATRKN